MPNFFDNLSVPAKGETFEELVRAGRVRIERITSSDTPEHTEYIQEHDEWVLLMKGGAVLAMDGAEHRLAAGDYLFIPKRTKHHVIQTEAGTVWLAVHIERSSL